VLGLYGTVTVFQATNMSIFNVLGLPHWGAMVKALEAAILLPMVYWAVAGGADVGGASWAIVAAQLAVIPIGMAMISRLLQIGFQRRFSVTWRPVLSTALMAAAVSGVLRLMPTPSGELSAALSLLVAIPAGAATYLGAAFMLWRLSGKPHGAESRLAEVVLDRLARRRVTRMET
jgi:lipopolysaccharide exporter